MESEEGVKSCWLCPQLHQLEKNHITFLPSTCSVWVTWAQQHQMTPTFCDPKSTFQLTVILFSSELIPMECFKLTNKSCTYLWCATWCFDICIHCGMIKSNYLAYRFTHRLICSESTSSLLSYCGNLFPVLLGTLHFYLILK